MRQAVGQHHGSPMGSLMGARRPLVRCLYDPIPSGRCDDAGPLPKARLPVLLPLPPPTTRGDMEEPTGVIVRLPTGRRSSPRICVDGVSPTTPRSTVGWTTSREGLHELEAAPGPAAFTIQRWNDRDKPPGDHEPGLPPPEAPEP